MNEPKIVERKKNKALKKIQTFVPKNLNIKKIKINPINIIENTKNKIGGYYTNLKKEREKQKIKLQKKRLLNEKKELKQQKKMNKKKN